MAPRPFASRRSGNHRRPSARRIGPDPSQLAFRLRASSVGSGCRRLQLASGARGVAPARVDDRASGRMDDSHAPPGALCHPRGSGLRHVDRDDSARSLGPRAGRDGERHATASLGRDAGRRGADGAAPRAATRPRGRPARRDAAAPLRRCSEALRSRCVRPLALPARRQRPRRDAPGNADGARLDARRRPSGHAHARVRRRRPVVHRPRDRRNRARRMHDPGREPAARADVVDRLVRRRLQLPAVEREPDRGRVRVHHRRELRHR